MKDFLSELDDELNNVSSVGDSQGEISKENKFDKEDKLEKEIQTGNVEEEPVKKEYSKPKNTKKIVITRKNKDSKGSDNDEYRGKFISKFPETKFYLPKLRDGYTRYMPVGGNNETGSKNMGMFQYGNDIILVDCGVQFTDESLPGVNYSIPDISYLTKYKKEIKGLLLTHAHLDHIGALKHILPALGMPALYGTKLTLGFARKQMVEAGLADKTTFVEMDANNNEKTNIGEFKVEYFSVNHSVPDCAGIYIETPGGAKFVHTGDFKIDYTPVIDAPAKINMYKEIGSRGITMLLSDSTGSTREGYSMSEKNVGEALEKVVANHKKGRLIIAAFSSWISRVQQLADIAAKYDKTIFLSGRSMVENVAIAQELGYLKIKKGIIKKMTPKATEGVPYPKQIIITTGSQGEQYSALTRMAEGKHNSIEIISGDTVVFSSSVVPGNDRSVVAIINKLIKLGADVITKQEDGEIHTGGHAFQEEQKMMIEMIKPRYFMPVYGDLYFRTVHKNTALTLGYNDDNVLMLENGQIVDFAPKTNSVFRSKIKAPIQEIIIDSNAMGLANSHVIKAREKMMESGVLVIALKVDKKSKAILGHVKIETRGLVYLDEVRFIHRMIIKKTKDIYENTIKDVPDIEEKDLFKIMRNDLENFLMKKIDRTPMIIPIVTEV